MCVTAFLSRQNDVIAMGKKTEFLKFFISNDRVAKKMLNSTLIKLITVKLNYHWGLASLNPNLCFFHLFWAKLCIYTFNTTQSVVCQLSWLGNMWFNIHMCLLFLLYMQSHYITYILFPPKDLQTNSAKWHRISHSSLSGKTGLFFG